MRVRFRRFAAVTLSLILALGWFLVPRPAKTVNAGTAGRIVSTGNTVEPRFDHTATLLLNGEVLIAAGMARNGLIEPTAELYDPHSGKFTNAGRMQAPRGWGVTATLLRTGKVLLAGGASASWCDASCYLASAELYDPSSNTFTLAGSMATPRAGGNAVLLQDGNVLIVGGDEPSGDRHVATAELYHPSTRTFSVTGSMHGDGPSVLVVLKNGKVLALKDSGAELYDPATGQFTVVSGGAVARTKFGAALLPDGKLLLAGGQIAGAWGPKSTATNIYDPVSGALTSGPDMSLARFKLKKAVVSLNDGRILIAGGAERPEIYDASSKALDSATGSRLDCYYFSTATRLSNGEVLIVGGYARPGGPAVNHAWLYQQ